MIHRMVGVEIGSHTLKLAVVSGGMIRQMAVERLPEDLIRSGRPTSAAALAEFLRGAMKRSGIRGGACALVLPSPLVIAHHVTMPRMNEAELRLNLPFEFRDFVGREGSKYDYDYALMDIRDMEMSLYAAAVPRDAVEEYAAILRRAGLRLKTAIPAEMAWANLIRRNPSLPRKLCVVDVGHGRTRVNIFSDGNFVMGKDIDIAGAFFDETIAKARQLDIHAARKAKELGQHQDLEPAFLALSMEVLKILNFHAYTDSVPEPTLSQLYCCGGSSVLEPLGTALGSTTGMMPRDVCQLLDLKEDRRDLAIHCAAAAGAAMQK